MCLRSCRNLYVVFRSLNAGGTARNRYMFTRKQILYSNGFNRFQNGRGFSKFAKKSNTGRAVDQKHSNLTYLRTKHASINIYCLPAVLSDDPVSLITIPVYSQLSLELVK